MIFLNTTIPHPQAVLGSPSKSRYGWVEEINDVFGGYTFSQSNIFSVFSDTFFIIKKQWRDDSGENETVKRDI